MNIDVSERAFEEAIEACLVGRPDRVIAEERRSYLDMTPGAYRKRRAEDYDRTSASSRAMSWTSC